MRSFMREKKIYCGKHYREVDIYPYKARSFVICSECGKKHGLPNPYETYSGITDQNASYEKRLDNYTGSDLMNDRDE